MSDSINQLVRLIYERFNARDIDGVLAQMSEDVAWANGMEGGHVHGRNAVRDYWTRQWAIVSPHVEPVSIEHSATDEIVVEVIQKVFDLDGKPLSGQDHGLEDKTVFHVFHLDGGKIARFDIRETN